MLSKTKLKTIINKRIAETLTPILNTYTLSEILSLMLLSNTTQSVINKKRKVLLDLFSANNLTPQNTYNIHDLITLYIYIKNLHVNTSTKKKYINYLNEFITTASSIHTNI